MKNTTTNPKEGIMGSHDAKQGRKTKKMWWCSPHPLGGSWKRRPGPQPLPPSKDSDDPFGAGVAATVGVVFRALSATCVSAGATTWCYSGGTNPPVHEDETCPPDVRCAVDGKRAELGVPTSAPTLVGAVVYAVYSWPTPSWEER